MLAVENMGAGQKLVNPGGAGQKMVRAPQFSPDVARGTVYETGYGIVSTQQTDQVTREPPGVILLTARRPDRDERF
jgi:hypothetical protein